MYTLYILKCSDNSLYTGIAKDLDGRLESHKNGTGSKYVRAHLPFTLVYEEKHKNRSSASKREAEIKKMTKKNKEFLFQN